MARASIFTWPLASTNSIALLQSLGAAGNFTINGVLASPTIPGGPLYQVVLDKIARTVSITSASNNSGVNFTVTGFFNGRAQTATIAGPTAGNTVYTTAVYFDVITSIASSAATVGTVSIGTGTTGVTHWFNSDQYIDVLGLSSQVVVTGTITYSFQTTLDSPSDVSSPTTFTPITAMTGATTSQLGSILVPTLNSRIAVTASDNTGAITATFVQQGL